MNILITGGASGLGQAITRKLAGSENTKVYFTYNSSAAKAREIEKVFPNTSGIKCDFKVPQHVEELVGRIEGYDIDVLVNNAYSGRFLQTHFHKTPSDDFLQDFTNNILPAIEITKSAINCFRKKRQGKVITVLSAAIVNVPPIGSSIYTAGKSYLQELTKIWAAENRKYNITSNSVSPSFMETALTGEMDARVVDQIRESHPFKKLLTVDEVADSVHFLVNAPLNINGIDILLNAGSDFR